MRAFWSGEIAFGLVTIPAKLYTATKDLTPQFHQLHTECGTRITMVRRCPKCNKDLAYAEIGKGYEVSKGEYALFTKEEMAKLEGDDEGGTIEIVEFVDPLQVDLAYIEKSYWVGPGGKNARGYDLLRAVLDDTKKVAVAKVKLRTRTRLALLRPRGKLFALDMMRFAEELVPADELIPADQRPPSDREKQLAMHLVDELSGPFDPSKHPDEYRSKVLAAVDEKVEAGQIAREEEAPQTVAPSEGAQVIDLAELLSRSIKRRRQARPCQGKDGGRARQGRAGSVGEGRQEGQARDGLGLGPACGGTSGQVRPSGCRPASGGTTGRVRPSWLSSAPAAGPQVGCALRAVGPPAAGPQVALATPRPKPRASARLTASVARLSQSARATGWLLGRDAWAASRAASSLTRSRSAASSSAVW